MNNEEKNKKFLIVTADDLGFSPEVNEGIIHSFLRGVVTEASAIVTMPFVENIAKVAKNINIPVGLHLDLLEGKFDENDGNLFGKEGYLKKLLTARQPGEEIILPPNIIKNVFRQFWLQLCSFRDFFGQNPSHLSYHDNLHAFPNIFDSYVQFSKEENMPFRHENSDYAYRDIVIDKNLDHGGILNTFREIPNDIMELSIHPPHEIGILTSKQLRQEIENMNMKLISFADAQELKNRK